MNEWDRIREPTGRAWRDGWLIVTASVAAWFIIEGTESCDRFFEWVAENPDYEVDSAILAFLLAAVGITIFAVRRYSDMRSAMLEQQAAEERAHALAYHDPLTGLRNRRAVHERIAAFTQEGTSGHPIGLLVIDLDRFKAVNDVYGHQAGDELLRAVSDRLQAGLSAGEQIYRLGGDEFALVCETNGDGDVARRAARRVVHALAQPFEIGSRTHFIGASVGIAMYPTDAQDRETLLRRADIALYRAKDSGRGQLRSFEVAMDAEITRRSNIENELRHAIRSNLLVPYFQPVVELASRATVGFELLARWPREAGDHIGPEQFVPIAEESGLITEMTLQLLKRACANAQEWDPSLTIAINISPAQLNDPWISQKILSTLTHSGFAPQRLAIEITENALIADADNAKRVIASFKNQGMKISLDDFGTGYSSLQHLRTLQFDKLKIDRSFVQAMVTNKESMKIVKAIANLASSLDLPVVAEGVVSEETACLLRKIGCAAGQGFHLGMPMSGMEVSAIMAQSAPFAWRRQSRLSPATDISPLSSVK